jgi:hypothetical protein
VYELAKNWDVVIIFLLGVQGNTKKRKKIAAHNDETGWRKCQLDGRIFTIEAFQPIFLNCLWFWD